MNHDKILQVSEQNVRSDAYLKRYRIVNFWKPLPKSVVSAPSVNCLKLIEVCAVSSKKKKKISDLKFATTL